MMLVSAEYVPASNTVRLGLYDGASHTVRHVTDTARDSLYCYTCERPSVKTDCVISEERRRDPFSDSDIAVYRVSGRTPSQLAAFASMAPTWESDMKTAERYLYDHGYVCGRHYVTSGEDSPTLTESAPPSDEAARRSIASLGSSEDRGGPGRGPVAAGSEGGSFWDHARSWAGILDEPVPEMRRVAMDIEIDTAGMQTPDVEGAPGAVTAVGFSGDGIDRVLVVNPDAVGVRRSSTPGGIETAEYPSEERMLRAALETMREYPVLVTWYGDGFDLPYIYNRCRRLGIHADALERRGEMTTKSDSIHLDLYQFFSNKSIQNYAFSGRYSSYSLDAVATAILGRGKTGSGADAGSMDAATLAAYCHNDAALTYGLTTFAGGILIRLMVIISRLSKLPLETVCRTGVSAWLRSMLYAEHVRAGILIPRPDQLASRTAGVANDAIQAGKKYRGGLVMDQERGVHFGVTVMDFASLYPSIVKAWNLSYETVRCDHAQCRDNVVPGTSHWVCTVRHGMLAVMLGSLRELRIQHYKPLSKDGGLPDERREQYDIIAQSLKVILNAGSGVMGFPSFALYYLPVAECITSAGRNVISDVAEKCRESGMRVLYGDTDSVFVSGHTPDTIKRLVGYSSDSHGVDLEVDKEYRYVVMSGLKKNYVGIHNDGRVDIKGLTGKKSHTPEAIRRTFRSVVDRLSSVRDESGFAAAKKAIEGIISDSVRRLQNDTVPLTDLALRVKLAQSLESYSKTTPQHVRAARLLERGMGVRVTPGDIIMYVKTAGGGVKPVEMAGMRDIDRTKYVELLESVLAQITDACGIDMDHAIGRGRQDSLQGYLAP